MELAFSFPVDRSLCPAIATTVLRLLCHHHFEICGYQDDPLQQETDGSCWFQIRTICWTFQDYPPEPCWHCD